MILTPEQPTVALHARNAAQSAHPELWRGLVAAWVPALGYQGNRLLDASEHANNLDNVGLSWNVRGVKVEKNDKPQISIQTARFNVTKPWSMFGWVYVSSLVSKDFSSFFGLARDDSGEGVGIGVGTGNAIKVLSRGETPNQGNAISINKWHQVGLIWDGTDFSVILDGQVDYAVTPTGSGWQTVDKIRIGELGFNATDTYEHDNAGVFLWQHEKKAKVVATDPLAPFRLRDDTSLVTAAMFGGTPSITIPPPLLNMQMTGSF